MIVLAGAKDSGVDEIDEAGTALLNKTADQMAEKLYNIVGSYNCSQITAIAAMSALANVVMTVARFRGDDNFAEMIELFNYCLSGETRLIREAMN